MSDVIDALERERSGYVLRGLDDRIAAVDAALAHARAAAPGDIDVADEPAADETSDDPDAHDGERPQRRRRRRAPEQAVDSAPEQAIEF